MFLEPPPAKRPKKSDYKIKEYTQISSDTEKFKLPNGADSLYENYYNQPYYIDKTLLIKELFKKTHVLITTPSRFSKTLNMNMVKSFVEIELDKNGKAIELDFDDDKRCLKEIQPRSENFKLFQGKNILNEKDIVFKHFGKYPTIYVNFGEVQADNFGRIMHKLEVAIKEAFRKHSYLHESSMWNRPEFNKEKFMQYFDKEKYYLLSEKELQSGLEILSKFLHGYHGKPVYVFIDELDAPLTSMVYESRMKLKDKQKTIALLQMIFKKLLKGNKCVERSLFNGCHQLGKLLLQSASNVDHYAFMQGHIFSEFYALKEDEVMDLLKKAGKFEKFNEIKEMYNGYKTTLRDGRLIQIYNPWVILRCLRNIITGFDYISFRIDDGLGHPKIGPKITQLKSGECVTIKYVKNYGVKDIEILSKFAPKNENYYYIDMDMNMDMDSDSDSDSESEIDDYGVDLFIQFLYEDGFLYPTDFGDDYLTLAIPNKVVHHLIDNMLYFIQFKKKHCDPRPHLIKKFTESLEDVSRLCSEDRVRALADSIDVFFRKTHAPRNESELSFFLFMQMSQEFDMANVGWFTHIGTRCDALLVIDYLKIAFIFDYKFIKKKSNYAYRQIFDKKHYTLLELTSLEDIFSDELMHMFVKNKIYLGIQMDKDGRVSITYSFNNMDPDIVVSRGVLN
ncbi:hypothetical protein PV325_000186 [Microctonus aethiopoides]|uniref:AAA-ATPase-like domain-containing protein n=1 Tax=Microctonus aethiopoides TaxID=144406 RepID=A0AA39FUF4_9HYME|nr:hypothetical protein PV325_000186 [Microctonus aethiopoides]KAK0093735.1 hypothetical protein PV326_012785 [Microctonus aethiopoides]KAK0176040.1 hypothetical protein PV328_000217 [Microctonus aethiopoides]